MDICRPCCRFESGNVPEAARETADRCEPQPRSRAKAHSPHVSRPSRRPPTALTGRRMPAWSVARLSPWVSALPDRRAARPENRNGTPQKRPSSQYLSFNTAARPGVRCALQALPPVVSHLLRPVYARCAACASSHGTHRALYLCPLYQGIVGTRPSSKDGQAGWSFIWSDPGGGRALAARGRGIPGGYGVAKVRFRLGNLPVLAWVHHMCVPAHQAAARQGRTLNVTDH